MWSIGRLAWASLKVAARRFFVFFGMNSIADVFPRGNFRLLISTIQEKVVAETIRDDESSERHYAESGYS